MIRLLVISFLLVMNMTEDAYNQDIKAADAVYYNGRIYTVDSSFNVAEAFAVKDGRILETGNNNLKDIYKTATSVNLNGKAVFPGFIDAHCHFYGYSIDTKKIWLGGTSSFSEVLDLVSKNRNALFMGWLFGRGWDQNDWEVKEFPDRKEIDSLFPDVPVFLMRIDGHAALVNKKALDLAGITKDTRVNGGEIVIKDEWLTGLLIDNAVDAVKSKIPDLDVKAKSNVLITSQQRCFEKGLTTVDDAGLEPDQIALIDSLQQSDQLKLRVYAMVSFNKKNYEYYAKHGIYKTGRLNVRSYKVYADGALGSRGAALLQPYSDLPGHFGFLLKDADSLKIIARQADTNGFQLNVHCIGDSANRLMLNIYKGVLKGKNDKRWRIEHAQVVAPEDLPLFGRYSIIPSVQPVHATSDMYWAGERLGNRLKNAYVYKSLLRQNGMIACGSDFPVESINPLYGFYAAVARRDHHGFPKNGFQPEEAITRAEALKGMTIWAAYANFEEKEKGSIEKGKFADFVILDTDIMTCNEERIYEAKVLSTYINGEKVFEKSNY